MLRSLYLLLPLVTFYATHVTAGAPSLPGSSATPDTSLYKGYTQINCPPAAKMRFGDALYALISQDMNRIYDEAVKGVQSPIFRAFFKVDENIRQVTKVFSYMNDTYPMPAGVSGRPPIVFYCSDEDFTTDPNYLKNITNSAVVLLRSKDYLGQDVLPQGGECFVDDGGAFKDEGVICNDVYCTTVRALAKKYLWELLSIYGRLEDQKTQATDLTGCLQLESGDQVLNAQNYAFFAAAVRNGCTEFPELP